jgi:Uma2 family endonuclease
MINMENAVSAGHKASPEGKISFEEFLAWADEDINAEWEDGEVVLMSPTSRLHQQLFTWLTVLLHSFVRHHKLGEVIPAPFLLRLQKSEQAREPDLLFIKTAHFDRLHDTYLEGPADLVIEIISPESISRDRGRKFVEYEAEGIAEYWLLDPIRKQAEFYQLGEDGHYHMALPDGDGFYHSRSVEGFWLRPEWMWQDPLPNELEILRQLKVLN